MRLHSGGLSEVYIRPRNFQRQLGYCPTTMCAALLLQPASGEPDLLTMAVIGRPPRDSVRGTQSDGRRRGYPGVGTTFQQRVALEQGESGGRKTWTDTCQGCNTASSLPAWLHLHVPVSIEVDEIQIVN